MIFRKLPVRLYTQIFKASYVTKVPKPEIPKNPLAEVYSATGQKSNGIVYDKKPFKVTLQEGKTYHWCLCGRSKSQPLCDGTHKDVYLKITQRPIRFTVEKTKDYWLCNCKQTKNRPFCDGAHKSKEVQETHIKLTVPRAPYRPTSAPDLGLLSSVSDPLIQSGIFTKPASVGVTV